MTTDIHPVSQKRHGGKSLKKFTSYAFSADQHFVPLVAPEVTAAARALPLGFLKREDGYSLAALLSMVPGRNQCVAPDGQWLGGYIPSAFRAWPFRLGRFQDGSPDKVVLCVDEASGLVLDGEETGDTPFFAGEGVLAPDIQTVMDFLVRRESGARVLARAVTAIVELNLLEPWPITARDGEREFPVSGIDRVNEAALNALAPDDLARLRDAGGLALAYAQLLSMGNLAQLSQLTRQQKLLAEKHASEDHSRYILENGGGNDDMKIDWDRLLKD